MQPFRLLVYLPRPLVLLLGAMVFCFAGAGLLAFRWNQEATRKLNLPPCFLVSPPQHHRFLENCQGTQEFQGRTIGYSINEHGLRERPFASTKPGQILVLGDSHVEGWGLLQEEGLAARLEEAAKGSGLQFLNGGIRSTGTVMQWLRAERLVPLYKPRMILWVHAENDLLDDRFSYGIATKTDAAGLPVEFSTEDFDRVAWLNDAKALSGFMPVGFRLLRYLAYQRSVGALTEVGRARLQDPCAAIKRMEALAKQWNFQLQHVALPMGPRGRTKEIASTMEELMACLDKERLWDLREKFGQQEDLFFPQDTHFSAQGMSQVAEETWLQLTKQLNL